MKPVEQSRTPVVAALIVALVGAVAAGAGSWSAPAFYIVGFVALGVYFALLSWTERPERRPHRHLATARSFVAFARRRGWVDDLVVAAERRREPADRTRAVGYGQLERRSAPPGPRTLRRVAV